MGRGLILVRHAMPDVVSGVDSREWQLGEAGRAAAAKLAGKLAAGRLAAVFSSNEPKAWQTADEIAAAAGLHVRIDAGFAEVQRPTLWDEDYRAAAARYLSHGAEDWESRESVVTRFGEAVERALAAHAGGDVVVVNHGLALSLYLAVRTDIATVPFWRELAFPDAWRLDLESLSLVRPAC